MTLPWRWLGAGTLLLAATTAWIVSVVEPSTSASDGPPVLAPAGDAAVDLTDDVDALAVAARATFPGTFAGIWRQPNEPAEVYLAFTERAHASAARLARQVGSRLRVRGVGATYPLMQLEEVQTAVTAAADDLAAHGIELAHVSVDVERNAVEVGVLDATADDRRYLRDEFGPAVVIVTESALPQLLESG